MAPLIAFEDLNARAYVYLLRIEVALRELVRRQLSRTLGDAWQKRLPGPFLAKIRDAQRDEEGKRRFGFLRLGPLYYLSFGELLEILQQQPARQALEPLGGAVILNELQNLLGPRNAIGHGRSVSQSGLAAIESVYRQLEIALGRSRLEALLADPDAGVWPETALPELRGWLTAVLESVLALVAPPPAPHSAAQATTQYWWNEPSVLPLDWGELTTTLHAVEAYAAIPESVGATLDRLRIRDSDCLEARIQRTLTTLGAF